MACRTTLVYSIHNFLFPKDSKVLLFLNMLKESELCFLAVDRSVDQMLFILYRLLEFYETLQRFCFNVQCQGQLVVLMSFLVRSMSYDPIATRSSFLYHTMYGCTCKMFIYMSYGQRYCLKSK